MYVDTSVMMGMTGGYKEGSGFDRMEYMVCKPENNFFPDLSKVSGCVWGGRGRSLSRLVSHMPLLVTSLKIYPLWE